MGLRHREFPVEGIQFHCESIMTAVGKNLLWNFVHS
jgi:para-aminobenzoate synthetase component 2